MKAELQTRAGLIAHCDTSLDTLVEIKCWENSFFHFRAGCKAVLLWRLLCGGQAVLRAPQSARAAPGRGTDSGIAGLSLDTVAKLCPQALWDERQALIFSRLSPQLAVGRSANCEIPSQLHTQEGTHNSLYSLSSESERFKIFHRQEGFSLVPMPGDTCWMQSHCVICKYIFSTHPQHKPHIPV